MCVELVARDVLDLWRLFHEKLLWAVENAATAFEGADPQEAQRVLEKFKASYDEKYPRVRAFLADMAELLSIYGIRLRTRVEEAHDWALVGETVGVGGGEEGGEEGEGVAVEVEGGGEGVNGNGAVGEEEQAAAPAGGRRKGAGRRGAEAEEEE